MVEQDVAAQDDPPPEEAEGDKGSEGAGEGAGADGGLTVGDRHLLDAYDDFHRALDALPGAAAFKALVVEYGQQFGYRAVGRWIAGRPPKAARGTPPRGAETDA
jgi:hypothetical protein